MSAMLQLLENKAFLCYPIMEYILEQRRTK